jgi:hypothetical protein
MNFKVGDSVFYNYTIGFKKTKVNCFINNNSKYLIDLLLVENKNKMRVLKDFPFKDYLKLNNTLLIEKNIF